MEEGRMEEEERHAVEAAPRGAIRSAGAWNRRRGILQSAGARRGPNAKLRAQVCGDAASRRAQARGAKLNAELREQHEA